MFIMFGGKFAGCFVVPPRNDGTILIICDIQF